MQLQGLPSEFVRVREAIIPVLGSGRKEIEVLVPAFSGKRGVDIAWLKEEQEGWCRLRLRVFCTGKFLEKPSRRLSSARTKIVSLRGEGFGWAAERIRCWEGIGDWGLGGTTRRRSCRPSPVIVSPSLPTT